MKHKHRLSGLEELGGRLREIRQQAGLSQMALAGRMGFNPTHGYKYVLRLEKGQVPNPTLRTIASVLAACSAGWDRLADVMPVLSGETAPARARAKPDRPGKPRSRPARGKKPEKAEPTPPPIRDDKPLRLRLRSELMARREERASSFWTRVDTVQSEAAELLRGMRVLSTDRHTYLAFVRPCCSVLEAYSSARPGVAERKVDELIKAEESRGLDRDILLKLKAHCLQRFRVEPGQGPGRTEGTTNS